VLPKHVIFEGIDGTGKDTQIEMLALKVKTLGKDVLFLRTPTGGPQEGSLEQWQSTESGQLLRKMWRAYPTSRYEAEYIHKITGPVFIADMLELDTKCWGTAQIQPEDDDRQRGWDCCGWVTYADEDAASRYFCIQSRSWASTFAYQHNQKATQNMALAIGEVMKSPDVWVYLHQPIETTLDRIKARAQGGKSEMDLYEKGDRLLATKTAFEQLFHEKWDDAKFGQVIWIRADQPAEDVHKDIVTALTERGIL